MCNVWKSVILSACPNHRKIPLAALAKCVATQCLSNSFLFSAVQRSLRSSDVYNLFLLLESITHLVFAFISDPYRKIGCIIVSYLQVPRFHYYLNSSILKLHPLYHGPSTWSCVPLNSRRPRPFRLTLYCNVISFVALSTFVALQQLYNRFCSACRQPEND